MKKYRFPALMALLAIMACLYVPAHAQSPAIFSVAAAEALPGETVSLEVTLNEDPGIAFMCLSVSYDETRLEAPGITGEGLSGWTIGTRAVWVSADNTTYEGAVLTLTFRVRDDAPEGLAWVSLDEPELWDAEENEVPAERISGGVYVLSASASPFSDVPAAASYYPAVKWAVDNGIVRGTGDGTTFSPNAECTRVQFALILYRMAGSPSAEGLTNPFKDLKGLSKNQKAAVTWAYNEGIIHGKSASKFDPNGTLTRMNIAYMLWRYTGSPAVEGTASFNDIDGLSANNQKAIAWASGTGLVKGVGDGASFAPNDNCLRRQLVLIVYRWARQFGP